MHDNTLTKANGTHQPQASPYPALTTLYCPMCASRGFARVLCSIAASADTMIVRSCQHCKSLVVFQLVKLPLENPGANPVP